MLRELAKVKHTQCLQVIAKTMGY